MDAPEKRLRLAAQSLNAEVLGFDADFFTKHLLKRLGIGPLSEDCTTDTVPRAGQASPGTGGGRRQSGTKSTTEFFDLELEELMHDTTLHAHPQVLRRIAELTEFRAGAGERNSSRVWWLRAAKAGDSLAALTVSKWESNASEETMGRQPLEDF